MVRDRVFLRNPSWDGLIVTDAYQTNVTVRSAIDCGLACSLTDQCESFIYTSVAQKCYLYDYVIVPNTRAENETGATYYYLQGSLPGPTSTICKSASTVLLVDGTPFTYRIHRTNANQSIAITNCANEGAELVKVLTVQKMQFLRQLISNCSDYNRFDFWIDGSNANAQDFNDITQWVTTDGQSPPSSTDFWGSGQPNTPTADHCVSIWVGYGHLWTDRPCTDFYPYICEISNN